MVESVQQLPDVRYLSNSTIDEQTEAVCSGLEVSALYYSMKRKLKEEILKPKYDHVDVESQIPLILEETGLATKLRNAVFTMHMKASKAPYIAASNGRPLPPPVEERLECVNTTRKNWEDSINEELRAIAEEQQRPLCCLRRDVPSSSSAGSGASGVTGISNASAVNNGSGAGAVSNTASAAGTGSRNNKPALRFLFDSEDLLDAIARIRTPNYSGSVSHLAEWGLIKVKLKTPTVEQLRVRFSDLHPRNAQIGLDELAGDGRDFLDDRLRLGEQVIANGYIPVLRQFAKRGVPASQRPQVWSHILGVAAESTGDARGSKQLFQRLQASAAKWDFMTDELYKLDVHNTTNDPAYFPFEETLEAVVMAFSRDAWLHHNSEVRIHAPLLNSVARPPGSAAGVAKGTSNSSSNSGSGGTGTSAAPATPSRSSTTSSSKTAGPQPQTEVLPQLVPPCGVQPFRGFVNYAAPLMYLYTRPEPIVLLLRTMYARYWCRLNAVRSAPDMLVHLCAVFEEMVQRYEPELFFHLVSLGAHPLQLAFPWIQFAFAGYLEPEQLLLLWDRVLGYDDLMLLPALAAAVFVFRSHSLLLAKDVREVQDVFADASKVKVIPLLQHFLFSDELARASSSSQQSSSASSQHHSQSTSSQAAAGGGGGGSGGGTAAAATGGSSSSSGGDNSSSVAAGGRSSSNNNNHN